MRHTGRTNSCLYEGEEMSGNVPVGMRPKCRDIEPNSPMGFERYRCMDDSAGTRNVNWYEAVNVPSLALSAHAKINSDLSSEEECNSTAARSGV